MSRTDSSKSGSIFFAWRSDERYFFGYVRKLGFKKDECMNLHALKKHIWAALLVVTLPVGSLYADQVWNGIVTPDALNENVDIIGNVQFNSPHVEMRITDSNAYNCNVTVPAVLSQNLAGAILDFVVANSSVIYVNVDNSLTFQGAGPGNEFIVTVSGDGTGAVIFRLADSTEVRLANGSYLMCVMDGLEHDNIVFTRQDSTSNADCSVVVGEGSLLGFAAENVGDTGRISFVPTNGLANSGRLKLVVEDGGSVAVQGYKLDNPVPFAPGDLDLTDLRGQSAELAIATSDASAWSGLQVINQNTIFPLLRTNPWYVNPAPIVAHQPGFILGINGLLNVLTGSYLEYVGLVRNMNPAPVIDPLVMANFEVNGSIPPVNTLVKQRNASALIVDGGAKNNFATNHPSMIVGETAKVYFLSGVDFDGASVNPDFTVDPAKQYTGQAGYGSIVFDVEGRLDVQGQGNSAINILSLKEANFGGSVLIDGLEGNFKLRNFEKIGMTDVYAQYGKACALVNGRINLNNTALQHTDLIHSVYEKNITAESEPTYIGGESFYLGGSSHRPTIALYNSPFLVHTDVALSGVDILTPNDGNLGNVASTILYHNGYAKDQGTGRNLILGTNVGSTAQDLGTIVDRAAHFDVRQETAQAAASTIRMDLLTAPNNDKVVEGIPSSGLDTQYSVHSIYLAHSTNISLGIFGASAIDPFTGVPFVLTQDSSTGTLRIDGHFFSFESQGGYLGVPSRSIQIGQGGIFVDNHGRIELSDAYPRVNMNAMIGLSYNGAAYLPSAFITYDKNIGISNSALDLSDPNQRQIIKGPATHVSDYTLDWKYITRDPSFIPYNPPSTPAAGAQAAPVLANILTIPTVYADPGEYARVDQFQIANSRLGDAAHLMINGGKVRELILQNGKQSGTVPTAVVALRNDGELGIGAAFTSPDSLEAAVVLGNNGLTIIADGNCQLYLNQDVVVDGVCHLLPGPNFSGDEGHRLEITSGTAKEFRIKRNGVLDLSLFNEAGSEVVFAGQVHLIFEPGSRLILGNDSETSQASLIFTDDSQVIFEKYVDADFAIADVSVKINGRGNIIFEEDAMLDLPRGAFVAVESGGDDNIGYITDLNIQMLDAATFYIGSDEDFGGALQIGNRVDYTGGSVRVNFTINGIDAKVQIGSQGFLGLGAGIHTKPDGAPNGWAVRSLYNVAEITANLTQGIIDHNEIYDGSNVNASLLAIGDATVLDMANFPATRGDIVIRGGGNMFLVAGTVTPVNPVVGSTDSSTVGILASRDTLFDVSKVAPATTSAAQFAYFKANPYQEQNTKYTQITQNSLGTLRLGYINDTSIARIDIPFLIGYSATNADPSRSLDQGSVIIAQEDTGTTSVSAFAYYM